MNIESQRQQKKQVQLVAPAILKKDTANLWITISPTEIEDRRTAKWSPDVIELDSPDCNEAEPVESGESEVTEEVEAEEPTEKIIETEKEESDIVEEAPVAVVTEETAM